MLNDQRKRNNIYIKNMLKILTESKKKYIKDTNDSFMIKYLDI